MKPKAKAGGKTKQKANQDFIKDLEKRVKKLEDKQ